MNAIITGASGDIGFAIAKKFHKEGFTLALIGNKNVDMLKTNTSSWENTFVFSCDFSDELTSIDEAIKTLGNVDLLVNCAGISKIGLITDITDNDWDEILSVNLSSAFKCCQKVVPNMVHNKKGSIINISSIWGTNGASCEVAYSTTKAGLNGLTKALAKELAPSNINVNALALGMIDTKMNSCFSKDEIKDICDEIPAGRMGTTKEVADAVYLLSKTSSYLTGQIITLDGGWM